MGIWERFKKAVVGVDTRGTSASQQLHAPTPSPPATTPRPDPADRPPLVEERRAEPSKQSTATSKVYEAEKRRAQAAGQTVKGYRAGYIGTEEAKSFLVADPDGLPPLKLVPSNNGLDFALPDGKLVDYNTLALRHFNIFAFRVVGMGYYEDPERPFKFRNGQRVAVKRESDNEHDPNAVAITVGRPERKVGYVNKQRAKWVAELLDDGQELEGVVIQTKASSPRVLLTTPEMLAHLRR
ncbi:HIRAN domain-containing protein [Arthrobacter sp. 92]|uniref:HIRAN domain-containing protein n=1 Tax=Arthrobacter sp. 92 TaxID=3418175 RepID=UPI003D0453E1